MKKITKGEVTNLCGKRIKLSRVDKDMNQLELATAMSVDFGIDVNQYSISQLERGSRYLKDYELIAFAEVLGKHPMWLLFGDAIPAKYQE